MRIPLSISALAILTTFCAFHGTRAATVWTGYTQTFSKPDDADPLLPQWQDHITDNVALTRDIFGGGLFNPLKESAWLRTASPVGTEWAYAYNNPGKTIAAANWQDLTFSLWANSFGGNTAGGPPGVVGEPAVAHLIEDDIYLDFRLTAWTIRAGGGVSYVRADAPTSADFNQDTFVNGLDLNIWKSGFGAASGALNSQGDADFDADVDGNDFLIWQRTVKPALTSAASLPSQWAVPEPAATLLITLGALTLAAASRPRPAQSA
jgi:hypothetical protein